MEANPQSIKEAMVRAVRQYSQRAEMSENALKCVEKNYWSSVAVETLEIYRGLVKVNETWYTSSKLGGSEWI